MLFAVQPMVGKLVLPLLGGGPSVWATCLVFFQCSLLLGYVYAHGLARALPPRAQRIIHLALLLAALAGLPIDLSSAAGAPDATRNPTGWLLALLIGSAGLPFLALTANAPLLQGWFAAAENRSPYALYAASNAGSLTGLLLYPAWVERRFTLFAQHWGWTVGYGILVALVAACGACSSRTAPAPPRADTAPPSRRRLTWFSLALVPSSLLLGVTHWISADIAPVPLLWTVPLALYLASFVMVFAPRPLLAPAWTSRALCLLTVCALVGIWTESVHSLWLAIPLHLVILFLAAWLCHGRLAASAPPPAQLTEYFFWIGAGGAAGGIANALLAPLVFDSIAEYPLTLIAATALARRGAEPSDLRRERRLDVLLPLALGAAALAWAVAVRRWLPLSRLSSILTLLPPALFGYSFVLRPARFALGLLAIFVAVQIGPGARGDVLFATRNFFGISRVISDPVRGFRDLVHGTTLHGRERAGAARCEPTAYYHPKGPLGDVMAAWRASGAPAAAAVIGLGAGAAAAYSQPGDSWTFYEIDPQVAAIARRYFDFLGVCAPSGPPRVVLGDARLRLRESPAGTRFGLIFLDAFSSDAVPVHLLTREAAELYRALLDPRGLLAVNASNTFLDLPPLFAALAQELRFQAFVRADLGVDHASGKEASLFVVMTRDPSLTRRFSATPGWHPLVASRELRAWSDDFSDPFGLLKWSALLPFG